MSDVSITDQVTPTGIVLCSVCGNPNQGNPRYCGECGAELKTASRRIREKILKTEGPRIQLSLLFGAFGSPEGTEDEKSLGVIRKRLMSRFRLLTNESSGKLIDLKKGRYLILIGANGPTEEDPSIAVNLGLKWLRLARVTKEVPTLHLVVATGKTTSKVLESTFAFDPTQEANLANPDLIIHAYQMLKRCPGGELYSDHMTYLMIRDSHRCSRKPEYEKSEKEASVADGISSQVYHVSGVSRSTEVGFEPPMIGREKELERLAQIYSRVEAGEGPVFFTLTGDIGIGKTRVLQEFTKRLRGRAKIFKNPRERRRLDRWKRTPYSYFGEILRSFFNIFENEDPANSREKLIKGLMRSLPRSNRAVPREMSHFIGHLCQVDFPESPFLMAAEDEPAQLEKMAFSALVHYLEQVTNTQPVVFVLDDLYSADSSSLRLIKHLIQNLESLQAFFIFSSRLELLSKLESEDMKLPGERLVLKPMTSEESDLLISAFLNGETELPEPVRRHILNLTDGNPFFIRESTRELLERGIPDNFDGKNLESLEIPGNIEGILQARFCRLTPHQQKLLQKASIFGRSFCCSGVEMLHRDEMELDSGWRVTDGSIQDRSDDLNEEFESLVHQGVLQHNSQSLFTGESQYSFVPSILQDLVYQEVPKKLRDHYHCLAAQWFEVRSYNKNNEEVFVEISYHYDLAGQPERAALYNVELGLRASKVSALQRAVKHLELGLEHLGNSHLHKKIEGLRCLSEVFIIQGQYQKALKALQGLLPLSWRVGHRVLGGELYTRIGWVYFLSRDLDQALEAFKNGHALHREAHNTRGLAKALTNMGKIYTVKGDYKQARLYLKEAMELRRDLGHAGDLAWTLNDMGNLLFEQGELDEAQIYHQEALEIRKSLGSPHMIIRSMNNLALIHMVKGNYDKSLQELLVSADLAEKSGEKLGTAIVLTNISELHLLRNDVEQAKRCLKRAKEISIKLSDSLVRAECFRLEGYLCLRQGNGMEALEFCKEAYDLITDKGFRSSLAGIYRLMGEIYAVLPEEVLNKHIEDDMDSSTFPSFLLGNALACFEESIAMAHQDGNIREEARSRMKLGAFEVERNNIARGRYQVERAHESFERLGMIRSRDEAAVLLEHIQNKQRHPEPTLPDAMPSSSPMLPPKALPVNQALMPLSPAARAKAKRKPIAVDQTVHFQVTFDDDEVGPPPMALELSRDEQEELMSVDALDGSSLPGDSKSQDTQEVPGDKVPRDETDTAASSLLPPTTEIPSPFESSGVVADLEEPTKTGMSKPSTETLANLAKSSAPVKNTSKSSPGLIPPPPVKASGSKPPPPPAPKSAPPAPVKSKGTPVPDSLGRPPLISAPPPKMAGAGKDAAGKVGLAPPPPKAPPPMVKPPAPPKNFGAPPPKSPPPPMVKPPAAKPPAAKPPVAEDSEVAIRQFDLDSPDPLSDSLSMLSGGDSKPPSKPKKAGSAPPKSTPPRPPASALNNPGAVPPPPKPGPGRPGAPKKKRPGMDLKNEKTTENPLSGADLDLEIAPFELNDNDLKIDPLNPAGKMKYPKSAPSIYDSQVIITQVSGDDQLSLGWFEEGRSDRQKQCWKERKEDLDEVHEEIIHEQVVEELDGLDVKE